MKKTFFVSFFCFFIMFLTIFGIKNKISAQNEMQTTLPIDFIEKSFPLVKITSPYFINDLSYNRDNNFLHHAFYYKFGINDCYVHKDIYPNMQKLEQILKQKKLRAVMYDCFRPHEAQMYMWKLDPNPLFLSNPFKSGSLHSKGLALDIGLADENGKKLEFVSAVDSFVPESASNYQCKKYEEYKCENRELLKSIMTEAGFRGIKREWWHYQKTGDTKAYPLINICNHPNSKCILDKTELK